jgi:hypothetical protein
LSGGGLNVPRIATPEKLSGAKHHPAAGTWRNKFRHPAGRTEGTEFNSPMTKQKRQR